MPTKKAKTCTLLILTYKGLHHLKHLLPTVRTAIANTTGFELDVLILDNGQHEPTREYVNKNFAEFRYAFSPVNDYLFSLNPYIEVMPSEYVFILNDDLKLHPDVLNHTLPVIASDPKLFAVSCHVMDWEGTYTSAYVRRLFYKRGWLYSQWALDQVGDELRYTLYGAGGAAVFRTAQFNQLGGFDPLYRPAYCEDLDLGHKAWHKGWEIVYQPRAIMYHREGGTIKDQFKANQLTRAIYKNQILWMVRNGNYPAFLLWFLLMLPYRVLLGWRNDKNSYIALLKSLPKLPVALYKRLKTSKAKRNDKNIMQQLGTVYKPKNT